MSKSKTTGPLVVKNQIVLPIIYTFMGICLLVAAILAIANPLEYAEHPLLMRIFTGGLGLPCALYIIISNVRKLWGRGSIAIAIDETGITDNSGFLAPGHINWDDIAEVYLLRLKDDTYLCVEPVDRDTWMAGLSRGQRRLAQANLDAGFAPFRIQFKKASDQVVANDGLATVRSFHPEKITHIRKPKY